MPVGLAGSLSYRSLMGNIAALALLQNRRGQELESTPGPFSTYTLVGRGGS